jgi:MoaA/NifB/PqqE/SkfB family radical SAM enzyme
MANIFLPCECNRNCVFCAGENSPTRRHGDAEIKSIIEKSPVALALEGGEPFLSSDLVKWIRLAKRKKVKNVIINTNGSLLGDKRLVAEVVSAGVDAINVNVPAHKQGLYSELTRGDTRLDELFGNVDVLLKQKIRVTLTIVINSLNYKILPDYVSFISKRFPKLCHINMVYVIISGRVTEDLTLVPRLSDVKRYLWKALGKESKVPVVVGNVPLCFMGKYGKNLADAYSMSKGFLDNFKEHAYGEICKKCTHREICPGPRKDYVWLHGWGEFKPFRTSPGRLKKTLLSR